MNLDYETIDKIEDYIQHLDETIGLRIDTVRDVVQALQKYKRKFNSPTPISLKSICDECTAYPFDPRGKTPLCKKCMDNSLYTDLIKGTKM
jgi:hypothetical protein